MFNRIISRIRETDRGRDSPPTSPSHTAPDAEDGEDLETAEGFLCPTCMAGFPSPEDLQTHYESSHADGSGNTPGHLCPMCRMKMKSMQELQDHYAHHHVTNSRNGDLETLKQEVAELHTTLREEKWYSEDLKREVERLHATVGSKDNGDKLELEDIYKQQIKTLEENKALLSSEVVLLRNQLSEAVETNINLKQEKDRLEQKAANMATEVVNLKANVDERSGLSAATELQCKEFQEQVSLLEAQLQQRPEADDVAVLRQELVQVQTLMDKMSLEREEEKEALATNFSDLQEKYERLQSEKETLAETLSLAPKQEELESLKSVLSENSSGTQQLQSLLQQKIQETMELQSKFSKVEIELQDALGAFLTEKTTCEELSVKLKEKEMAAEEIQLRLSEQTRKCDQQESLIIQHTQLLKTSEADLTTTQTSLNQLREEHQQQLLTKEQQLNGIHVELEKATNLLQEKDSRIDSLSRQLDTLQSQFQQQIIESDDIKTQLWDKQNLLDEESRQKESRETKVQELENAVLRYKDTTERLESERTDLYAKIEAGDGANTAIQQLKQETASLQEKLAEQQKRAEQQTVESAKKLESLHKLLKETKGHLQSANDKCGKLESSMKDLSAKLEESQGRVVKLEADLKTKSDLLLASEAAKVNQKMELESQLQTTSNAFSDQSKLMEKLKEKCQKSQNEVARQQNTIQQLQTDLTQEVERSGKYQTKCETLEASAVEQTEEISTLISQNKELKASLQEANTRLTSLERELKEVEESSRGQIKSLEEVKTKLQQQVHRLETERTGLLNEKNIFEKQYGELEDTLSKRITMLQDSLDATEAEKKGFEVQLDELQQAKQNEAAEMKEQIVLVQSLFEQQRSEVVAKSKEIGELTLHVTHLEEVKHDLEQNVQSAESKTKEQADELQKQVEDIQRLKAELKEKEKTLETLQQQLQNLRAELQQHEATSRTNRDDLSQLRKAHEEVVSKLRDVEKKLRESQAEFAELQKLNQGMVKDLDESQQNEQALVKSLEDLNQVKSVLGQQMLKLDTELKKTMDEHQRLTVQKASLETELFTKQQALSDLEEKCNDAEKRLLDFQKTVAEERNENEKIMMGLQAARELLITQKVEIKNQLDTLTEQLTTEQKSHQQAKATLKSQLEALQIKSRESIEELTSLQSVHQSLRLEKEQKEARYEMQISALNENLTTLRGDFISEQNKAQDLEKKVDDLSGDKLELEAKLENALDERRALLERCLASEGECEQLRSSSTEIRHKLDDALAAIHELGRENQTLQIESAKLTSRKWAEDAEVTNCTLCQKLFSVTIRKHHCRNCGNIFCSECSTRSATVAASKKRVRVCDLCFAELSK